MQPGLRTVALTFGYSYLGRRYYGVGERGMILELISPSFASWVSWAGVVFWNLIFFMYRGEVVLSFGLKERAGQVVH